MTTEQELREILAKYGIGLDLRAFSKHDRVNLYPTRYKGVHRIELGLRGHLASCPLDELLKCCLSKEDFQDWQTSTVTPRDEKAL